MILLSNDDGIHSDGLLAVRTALKDIDELVVVAPIENNSAVGYKMNIMKRMELKTYNLKDGSKGYGLSGTPVDSVNVGLNCICDKKPILTVLGINVGANLGKFSILNSGTVSGALESARLGVPAIACSQFLKHNYFKTDGEVDYSFAQKILRKLVKKILNDGFPKNTDVLNLNIPAEPISEKIKMTSLTDEMLSLNPVMKNGGVINKAMLKTEHEEGTDAYCIMQERKPSLTPLNLTYERI